LAKALLKEVAMLAAQIAARSNINRAKSMMTAGEAQGKKSAFH
jgi:AmiR/NasT family two-component response regulator